MPNLLWWSKSLLCWWSKSLLRWWSKSLAAVRFNASPLRLRSVIDKKWSKSRGIKYPEALDFYDYYKGQMEAWDGPTLLLFRSSGTIMAYVGIELSSPTLASALLNLVPAFTFILALIFRLR